MATYSYRCSRCGPFDIRLPIGSAPTEVACPTCDDRCRRVFTAPALSRVPREVARLREREEQSRSAPEVVTTPPPGSVPRPHRGLPRT